MKKIINTSAFMLGKLAAVLMFAMVVVVTIQIVGRGVLNISTPWTEEFARYILIWMTFLGSPVVLYKGQHLMVDLFYVRFSPRARHGVHLFSDLFILVFCGYIAYFGFMLCTSRVVLNFVSPAAGIPRVFIYSALPVGAGLMMIYILCDIWDVILIMLGKKEDTTASTLVDETITIAEMDLEGVKNK